MFEIYMILFTQFDFLTIYRYPKISAKEECCHPAFADKWMNDLEFFSATIGDTIFYKGQLCKFVEDGNHQIGRIETFIENVQVWLKLVC